MRYHVGMTRSLDAPADVQARTGFCECGCGQRTWVATSTHIPLGRWRGYPTRFIRGHAARLKSTPPPADVQARTGLCQCGCGQRTSIPRKTDRSSGRYAGQPLRFVNGHGNGRRQPVPADVRARTGLCECGCGRKAAVAKATNQAFGNYAGYPTRFARGHQASKPDHATWIGGDGYVYTTSTGHPNAHNGGKIAVHRLAMSNALGRPLTRTETVHHVNGDRTDNRPENLQLRQGKHGQGAVWQCRSCGGHDVVATPLGE